MTRRPVWTTLALICLIGGGCSPATSLDSGKSATESHKSESKSSDPVKSFEALLSSIQSAVESPREYLELSTGTFNEGLPEIGGKPYVHYNRELITWRVKGYDVKRTDSMVSPFEAILVMEKKEDVAPGDGQGKGNTEQTRIQTAEGAMRAPYTWSSGWKKVEGTYSWRDNRWVFNPSRAAGGYPFDPTAVPWQEKEEQKSSYKRLK